MSNRKLQVRVFVSVFTAMFLSSLSYAATADRITSPLSSQSVALHGNVDHNALPKFDQGPVDPGMRMGTMTLLTLRTPSQQKALASLIAEQQDQKSPNYRKWLTPTQIGERFGLSQHDLQQIAAWLKAQGFTGIYIAHGRNFVSFNGTAAQAEAAFGTEIHRYNVNGTLHYANVTSPRIPAAMAGVVTAIRGLNDFRPRALGVHRRVRPYYYDSSEFGQIIAPGDIAAIYDINALYSNLPTAIDGTGQSIAVAGQTDVYLADLQYFRSGFSLPAISCTTNSSNVITACSDPHFLYVLDGDDPGISEGDLGEADLDLEYSAAVARGAQIVFVNSTNVFESYYYAIDNDGISPFPTISAISLSYGLCELGDEGYIAQDDTQLAAAVAEGITFVNSAGDSGAAECDPNTTDPNGASATGGIAVSWPASSSNVTGAGGTAVSYPTGYQSTNWSLTSGNVPNGASAVGYIPETAWNDNQEFVTYCDGGCDGEFPNAQQAQINIGIASGGGGASNCYYASSGVCTGGYGQPSWQSVTISGQAPARFSPDVSFLASPNFVGYIWCTPLEELPDLSGTTSSCSPGGTQGIQNALALTDPDNGDPDPSIVGGTSASAPVFAGMVALLNQFLGTTGLGNANVMLYQLAAQNSTNGAFNQVTTGNNTVYCTAGTPAAQPTALQCPSSGILGFDASNADATTGYNLVTGLGSVNLDHLAIAWQAATPAQFTLTPTVSSIQVIPGSSANASVLLALASSFSGTVTFTCTEPSSLTESTCTPPSATNASGTVSFSISTTPATSRMRRPFDRGAKIFYAALLPGMLGIVFTFGSRKRSSSLRGMRMLGLIMVLGASTLWLGSCGGSNNSSSNNQGTPAGSYTITVAGTSGGVTATSSFVLVVQ
jgi:subtilase family serine protease